MDDQITPKQVAQAIGVSESSIKRWCDSGALKFHKTAGGHRRIRIADVLTFCRENGFNMQHPELLRLPSNTGHKTLGIRRAQDLLVAALLAGEVEEAYRILADLYLAGTQVPVLCDQVLAPAFHQIGDKWVAGMIGIYEERRACEITVRIVSKLKGIIEIPQHLTLQAMGATLQLDHYQIANVLIDLTLTSLGWQSAILGCNIPDRDIQRAVYDQQPDLLWLSMTAQADEAATMAALTSISSVCRKTGTRLVVGGRAVDLMEDLSSLPELNYFPNMQSLADWCQKGFSASVGHAVAAGPASKRSR
jgi:excisionase family DNA binding protein